MKKISFTITNEGDEPVSFSGNTMRVLSDVIVERDRPSIRNDDARVDLIKRITLLVVEVEDMDCASGLGTETVRL